MTSKTAANLLAASQWLSANPDLPEPYAVSGYPHLAPSITWHTDEATARSIIAAVQGEWRVYTYDDKPQTIATLRPEFDGTVIDLSVGVVGVNLPDLAATVLA